MLTGRNVISVKYVLPINLQIWGNNCCGTYPDSNITTETAEKP